MAFAGTREPAQTTSRSSPGRRPPRPLFWLSLWWCTASSLPRLASSVIRSGPNAQSTRRTVAWLRGLAIASQRGAAKRHASCFNFYTRLRHGSTGATLGPAHLQTRQRCAGPPQFAAASFCRARRIAGRPPRGFSGEEQSSIGRGHAAKTLFLKPFSATDVKPRMRRDDVNGSGGNGGFRQIELASRRANSAVGCAIPYRRGSSAVGTRSPHPLPLPDKLFERAGRLTRPHQTCHSTFIFRSAERKAANPVQFSQRFQHDTGISGTGLCSQLCTHG
jgi:hypothetical protein